MSCRSRRATAVLFATDGLHEWRNPDGIEVGDEQIGALWLRSQRPPAHESLERMFASVREFSEGGGAHDDTTAVVLRVLG